MAVWVDGNQDGITDAGELRSLDDLGIVSLDLGATATTVMDHGNLVGLVSTYTTEDGAEHQMADVWMAKDRSVAGIPTDLLVDPGESVLPGDAAADAPVSVASVAAPVEVLGGCRRGIRQLAGDAAAALILVATASVGTRLLRVPIFFRSRRRASGSSCFLSRRCSIVSMKSWGCSDRLKLDPQVHQMETTWST
ncbi:MAG: hypothetical protein R3E68_10135 [Burkholderiaceae bacterium]